MPEQTRQRYLIDKTDSDIFIWSFTNHYTSIPKGKVLRIQCMHSASVRWTSDNWKSCNDVLTLDSGLGVHYADLQTGNLGHEKQIIYTFFWNEAESWEGKNFILQIEKNNAEATAQANESESERDKIKVFLPS